MEDSDTSGNGQHQSEDDVIWYAKSLIDRVHIFWKIIHLVAVVVVVEFELEVKVLNERRNTHPMLQKDAIVYSSSSHAKFLIIFAEVVQSLH